MLLLIAICLSNVEMMRLSFYPFFIDIKNGTRSRNSAPSIVVLSKNGSMERGVFTGIHEKNWATRSASSPSTSGNLVIAREYVICACSEVLLSNTVIRNYKRFANTRQCVRLCIEECGSFIRCAILSDLSVWKLMNFYIN